MVSRDYFRTFGIPIVEGRDFTDQDGAGTLPVAIVNESFRQKYLSGLPALGARLVIDKLGVSTLGPPVTWTIVGVCRNVHNQGVRPSSSPEISVPFWQNPLPWLRITVRTASV